MRLEIPKFTRCCFCVPLRYGIITLGYLSLVYTIYVISVEVYFMNESSTYAFGFFRGAIVITERWLILLMHSVEIVLIIVLLIGAHLRNKKLILAYYYYGITTTLAGFTTFLFIYLKNVQLSPRTIDIIDFAIMFSAIATQVYLLLLIRSELNKPREALRYVNHLAEVSVQPSARENGRNPL